MKPIKRKREEIYRFLNSLRWERVTRKELRIILSNFFGKEVSLENGTDEECKDVDYSFMATTGNSHSTTDFVDMEIYYLKTRDRKYLITDAVLLDYME